MMYIGSRSIYSYYKQNKCQLN